MFDLVYSEGEICGKITSMSALSGLPANATVSKTFMNFVILIELIFNLLPWSQLTLLPGIITSFLYREVHFDVQNATFCYPWI